MKKSLTASLILFTNFLLIAQTFPGVSEIKRDDLINTVRILSSHDFDGRLAGSEGYNKAAEFAANKFLELGLKPAGDEKYFQYFNIEYNKINSPANFKTIVNGDTAVCQLGKDFVMRGFTGSNKFTLPVAFCGYGISKPDIGYDDYAGIDVRNKIVLVFKQNPGWKINDKDWGTNLPREKSLVARNFGARGILFVSLPNDKNPQSLIGSILHGDGEQPVDFPQLHISIDVANNLLSRTG
ncbi:MAG TPA: PA domain-containing protein, partial [Ignavibacteriaceae bacterium]